MTDKERYATIGPWIEVLQREEVSVCHETLRTRLKAEKVIGETARSRRGNVIYEGFYGESDVRRVIADLLRGIPKADEDGFFKKDGEYYGSLSTLTKFFGIAGTAIKPRIQKAHLSPVLGKDPNGQIRDFFPLSAVQETCGDLLQSILEADEDGMIQFKNRCYAPVKLLAKKLGLSDCTVGVRVRRQLPSFIQGRDRGGRVRNFYSEEEVRQICADLLTFFPETVSTGVLDVDGSHFCSVFHLSKLFGLAESTVQLRINQHSLSAIRGKNAGGQLRSFYRLKEVRCICADLLDSMPHADKDGIILRDGITYGTFSYLSRLFEISISTIQARLLQHPLSSLRGKDRGGRVQTFYSESELRKILSDLPPRNSNQRR